MPALEHADAGPTANEIARQHRVDEGLLERVRDEFREMPGLCLTLPQCARLWNLGMTTAQLILTMLVDSRFLIQTEDGRYTPPRAGVFTRRDASVGPPRSRR